MKHQSLRSMSLKGFEPPTHGLEGRCSIQLSYRLTTSDSLDVTLHFHADCCQRAIVYHMSLEIASTFFKFLVLFCTFFAAFSKFLIPEPEKGCAKAVTKPSSAAESAVECTVECTVESAVESTAAAGKTGAVYCPRPYGTWCQRAGYPWACRGLT